ncbi:MAG: hypothetical protein Q8M98_06450 [Candidatus Cloacimonadaceae bacterium]|nr:hypothetical protein [Candidatus Cloacimonadaceae bacterium]
MDEFDDIVDYDGQQDDALGNSLSIEPNHVNDGAWIYEDYQLVGEMTPTITGGVRINSLGNSQGMGLEDSYDALGFDYDNVQMPWDDNPAIVGTPNADQNHWQQQETDFTCAVQAQRGIIEQFTGEEVSESQLVYEATANGWLTENGMNPDDVGNLLELHGVPCHTNDGASIQDLMSELSEGRKVIVGVDSGELWHGEPLEDFFHQSADHAIWVTGVDFTDPNNPQVIINDSGDPNGAGKQYALNDFMDAWQDSGFNYVATDISPNGGSTGWGSQLTSFLDDHSGSHDVSVTSPDLNMHTQEIDFASYIDSLSDTDVDQLLMYL